MHANRLGNQHQYRAGPGRRQQAQEPQSRASVLRTNNFKKLATAAGGADILGGILDLTVGRLKALENGEEFSDETAFYLETELNLPSGWFDQKNPQIPDTIAKVEDYEEPTKLEVKREQEAGEQHVAPMNTTPQVSLVAQASDATSVSKKTSEITTVQEPSVATKTQDPVETYRAMRRTNLVALTSWPKSKSGLARILKKTPANVSHLIHGDKNFDRDAALEIEQALGLPENWFETNHSAADVPQKVVGLLTGGTQAVPAPATTPTPRKRGRPRKPNATAVASLIPGKAAAAAAKHHAQPAATPSLPTASLAPRKRGRPPKAAQPENGSVPSFEPHQSSNVALPQGPVMTEATRTMLRTSEGRMGAIAEALVKTVIEKSRTGVLSEKAAYKMLSELMDA